MLSKILSYGLCGLDGFEVVAEVDITGGLPTIDIVGLADTAVKESRERVKSAIKNSGLDFPTSKITINLAPADVRKEGPVYDLPIAVGILSAINQVSKEKTKDYVFLGELSLDGSVRKINGVLPILISAREKGYKNFIIPYKNLNEASFISEINVFGVKNLKELTAFLNSEGVLSKCNPKSYELLHQTQTNELDFSMVKGQSSAKRALEIAAAGGHNVIMVGPPGSGKTMLAKCFPSILPDMSFEEALEVTKIYSIAGLIDNDEGIVLKRPFRSPHHSATTTSLTGGTKSSKPGEISLAHNGVLFLDEMPEYTRQTIEALRQPLEDGKITVARAAQTVVYPASFTLIASMNPCPCGYYGSKTNECKCTPSQIHRYLAKLSGPLMDRIDLHIEVDSISYNDLTDKTVEESSQEIKKRVDMARKIQLDRFSKGKSKTHSNAQMSVKECNKYCILDNDCQELLKSAFAKLKLSARAHNRILKVARTIADLDGSENIEIGHIAEAIQYRSLDGKYW